MCFSVNNNVFDRVALKTDVEKLQATQSQQLPETATRNCSNSSSPMHMLADPSRKLSGRISDANNGSYSSQHELSDLTDTSRGHNNDTTDGFIIDVSSYHSDGESNISQPFMDTCSLNQSSMQSSSAKKSRIEAVDQLFDIKSSCNDPNVVDNVFSFSNEYIIENGESSPPTTLLQRIDNACSTQVWSNVKDVSESVLTMMENEDW